jgi:hypothetical protein
MKGLNQKTILLPVFVLLGLGLAGCGLNLKGVACQQIIEISNQVNPAPETNSTETFSPQEALQQAERALQKAKQLEAIALQDPKLQEYKSRFVQLYQQEGEALKTAAEAALAAQGIPKTDPKFVDESLKATDLYLKVTEVYQQQLTALQEFTTYCEGQ